MNVQQKAKGFTIIEVVLVLAIAGLIFLMVFIALPALQRTQRDSARKTEVGTVMASIQSYMSNNRNAVPTAEKIMEYVTGETGAETLESGVEVFVVRTSYGGAAISPTADVSGTGEGGTTLYQDQIKVWFGYKCEGQDLVRGTSKQAAVVTALESGPSGGEIYCENT